MDNSGAVPESAQVTVKVAPPGTEAPAAGIVNLTSAATKWTAAARKRSNILKSMFAVKTSTKNERLLEPAVELQIELGRKEVVRETLLKLEPT